MDGTSVRKNLWMVVWAVAIAMAVTGLGMFFIFLPKVSLLAGRYAVDAQLHERASDVAIQLRSIHALLSPMLFGAALLAIALSVSRSRWKSRILTIGPAVLAALYVAQITGRILSAPETAQPFSADSGPISQLGSIPLGIYAAHVLGGAGAVLGVIGVWAISRRTGRAPDEMPQSAAAAQPELAK